MEYSPFKGVLTVNHFADIDEGVEVFDDQKERERAENKFRRFPSTARVSIDGDAFTPTDIHQVILLGSPRSGHAQPGGLFDFEDGYLEATGYFEGSGSPLRQRITIRWSDYGRNVQRG